MFSLYQNAVFFTSFSHHSKFPFPCLSSNKHPITALMTRKIYPSLHVLILIQSKICFGLTCYSYHEFIALCFSNCDIVNLTLTYQVNAVSHFQTTSFTFASILLPSSKYFLCHILLLGNKRCLINHLSIKRINVLFLLMFSVPAGFHNSARWCIPLFAYSAICVFLAHPII